jgi:hypothetical protein
VGGFRNADAGFRAGLQNEAGSGRARVSVVLQKERVGSAGVRRRPRIVRGGASVFAQTKPIWLEAVVGEGVGGGFRNADAGFRAGLQNEAGSGWARVSVVLQNEPAMNPGSPQAMKLTGPGQVLRRTAPLRDRGRGRRKRLPHAGAKVTAIVFS